MQKRMTDTEMRLQEIILQVESMESGCGLVQRSTKSVPQFTTACEDIPKSGIRKTTRKKTGGRSSSYAKECARTNEYGCGELMLLDVVGLVIGGGKSALTP